MHLKMRVSKSLLFIGVVLTVYGTGCATSKPKNEEKKLSKADEAKLYVDMANASLLEQDSASAFQNLAIAESLDPGLPELHHTKSLAYSLRGDKRLAIDSAKQAVDLLPKYPDARTTLAKLLLDEERYSEAEEHLLAATEDPAYAAAYKPHTLLGILYYRKNDLIQSERQLNQAIRLSPKQSCIAYYYRGHLDLKKGLPTAAIEDYQKATREFCGSFVDAHFALALAYKRNGQFDLARKKFLDIKKNFPESAYAKKAMSELRTLP